MLKSNATHRHLSLLLGLSLALGLIGSLGFWPTSQVQAGATLPPGLP